MAIGLGKGVKNMDEHLLMSYLLNQSNTGLTNTQEQVNALVNTNSYTQKFGVRLTQEEAKELVVSRKENLIEQGRIEFGEGVLTKLIFAFCDSPYIYQDNYVESIERLQEIFYLYKNESLDEVTDDELIDFMKNQFEGKCQGSLDYLEDTSLEEYARWIRRRDR